MRLTNTAEVVSKVVLPNKHTGATYTPIVDADMLVYMASVASEYEIEWANGLWTLHSYLDDAILNFKAILSDAYEGLLAKYPMESHLGTCVMAFSDSDSNFRKEGVLPSYKENRKGKRKPVCYLPLKGWVEEHYPSLILPSVEADDVMGILATKYPKDDLILVSRDKDFKTVPCTFFNFGTSELHHITERDAVRAHAYQTLVGDTADNYKGCPSYGDVKATKLLEKTEDKDIWNAVIGAFEKAGLTADDALVQARCAYILHAKNYNEDDGTIRMWGFPNVNNG